MQRSDRGPESPVGTITIPRQGFALGAIALLACLPLGSAAADGRSSAPSKTYADSNVSWSGVYAGAGLGVALGDAGWRYRSGFAPESNPLDLDRTLDGGFHLGIQRQWGTVVAELETSVLFGDLGGNSRCTPPASPFTCSVDVNWIWMIGPRLGLAAHNLHLYATGGYALGDMDTKSITTATGALFESGAGRHTGWYLGGGLEWSLGKTVVLGVEYRRIELDDAWHRSSDPSPLADRSVDATIDTVQARLTFKLGELLHGMPWR